jgi:hypothetical protein
MADEKIKLSLDYGESSKDSKELTEKLEMLKTAADAVGGEFGELVAKSAEVGKTLDELAKETDKTATAIKPSLGSIVADAQSLFSAFKSGDIKGISTSVSGLVAMVPALLPWAAGIAAAGSAAAVAWPVLKEWWTYLEKLNGELKEQAKGLTDYVDAQRKANEVIKETDALVKAREADALAKKTPGAPAKEGGERFAEGIAGHEEATTREITDSLDTDKGKREAAAVQAEADYQARMAGISERAKRNAHGDTPAAAARNAKDRIEGARGAEIARRDQRREQMLKGLKTRESAQTEAEEMIAKAKGGDADALDELQGRFGPMTVIGGAARNASPEQIEMEHDARLAHASNKEFRAAQKKQQDEKQAAYEKIPARIAQDNEAQRQKMIGDAANSARGRAAVDEDEEKADAKLKKGIAIGRDAGHAAAKAKAQEDAALFPKGLDLGHLPLIPENATPEQIDQIMGGNARRAALEAARPVMPGDRNQRPPMPRRGVYTPRRRTRLLQPGEKAAPNADRSPSPEQERSAPAGPTAMDVAKPLGDIMAGAMANTGAQQQQIRGILDQLRRALGDNTSAIQSDRSGASMGSPA